MSDQMNPNQPVNNNQAYYPNPYYYPQATGSFYPAYSVRQYAQPSNGTGGGQLTNQQSFIENILRLNRGKLGTFYLTFEGQQQTAFRGYLEAAGRDHILIREEDSERRFLLLMVYLDYVLFDEEINYSYPYDGIQGQLSNYNPR
ncbi:spore coat protein GerQ [Oceanobacillus oncorhynchi]|uniref:spore coat protein GerQ n=1 Tax=Oceanobacillus oncorhynchi TaxID=545501 RepID=UPI001866C504|nr:spore coat protein GerQ [Oceanobacillus oncorhynchi]MDM8098879.1 spore coat protein GerQ [Oceanobacillus oncorhynchi]